MGLFVAVVCYCAVAVVKRMLGYDDTLDAFGVHGVGGTVGALLTGVFVSVGSEASFGQFMAQLIAVVATILYAGGVTAILYFIVDKAMGGFRASEEDEAAGLDISQHGEVGYDL